MTRQLLTVRWNYSHCLGTSPNSFFRTRRLGEETPSQASLVYVTSDYGHVRPLVARASHRQRAVHLLDTLAHSHETKAIMAIGRGESFSIILEFQSKFLLVEVEARFESAGASILFATRADIALDGGLLLRRLVRKEERRIVLRP